QMHEQIQKDRMQEQQAFFLKFVNAGVIHLDRPSEMESLLTSCWIISNYWLSFLESSGMPTDEGQVERGIELILTILKPYLTESK
ncbi:TetR/AcrR family transcriptional regulator, partial [Peribacillus sp. NPDC056705]|uniref:TetR/AcrR family transcriptional regulator n=1 Tax=Peribacillus sp. NPDC056705 TaxID=3345918 RepID=UPI00374960ED